MTQTNEHWIEVLKEKRIKINEISPSFCSAKWLQTTLYLQNGYNHSCHHPSPHKIPVQEVLDNPAALHNSNFKKQQRIKMLNGERPSECDYCWRIEDQDKDHFLIDTIKLLIGGLGIKLTLLQPAIQLMMCIQLTLRYPSVTHVTLPVLIVLLRLVQLG